MTKEISKNLMCLAMRSGQKIWLEEEQFKKLNAALQDLNGSTFIEIEGRVVNTADISGIFTAADMEGVVRERNGQWKCKHGGWHDRGEKCECLSKAEKQRKQAIADAIDSCWTCKDGMKPVSKDGTMGYCDCIKEFYQT